MKKPSSRKDPQTSFPSETETEKSQSNHRNPRILMISRILRILLAVGLISLSWPPVSIGLVNIFVLLPAIAGIAILLWPLFHLLLLRLGEKTARRISRVILCLILAGILALGISFALIKSADSSSSAPDDAVVIVLGAQVIGGQPSMILSGRIRAAADYLAEHQDALCVASGGQGADESKSEAAAIRDTLVAVYNIAPERILLEDQSTSTRENLAFSLAILDTEGLPRNVLIATDAYHMYRAKEIAKAMNMTPYPLPATTDSRLVVPMTLREMLAIWAEFVLAA